MYTGDLVLPGFGESGGDLREDGIHHRGHKGSTEYAEKREKDNAEFAENAECAEKSGTCYLVAGICYPEI